MLSERPSRTRVRRRLLAPVNPCGFGLPPAVLTATSGAIGSTDNPGATVGPVARLAAGLRAGLALALGFTATFTIIGLLLTVGVRSVITLVPWVAAALGAVLALAGLAMLTGWHPALRLPGRHPDPTHVTGTRGLVAFGSGYAIASASCTLAVLLAGVTQAASTTWIGVIAVFTAYAAGSALLWSASPCSPPEPPPPSRAACALSRRTPPASLGVCSH